MLMQRVVETLLALNVDALSNSLIHAMVNGIRNVLV